MKLHASAGADILSAIEFPYPVVPIVRHHHEHWDGTGYPAGLRTTDIPIGARILAVVDCFDALTSDRPYRPKLSDTEALQILIDRRGSLYDPLIVDAFTEVYQQLVPVSLLSGPSEQVLNTISGSTQVGSKVPNNDRADNGAEGHLAFDIAARGSLREVGDVVVRTLRPLVPHRLSVIYLYEAATDQLEAVYASGDGAELVRGLGISLGHDLSGWVAVNRQTIVNSHASLDLGELANAISPSLLNALSTPLLDGDQLIGVLTLYSRQHEGFSDDHRKLVETLTGRIATNLRQAADADGSTRHDQLTGLPNLKQLESEFLRRNDSSSIDSRFHTVLFLDVVGLKRVNGAYGRPVGDEVLRYVAHGTRMTLEDNDRLYRYGSDEFVVLLNTNDQSAAETIRNVIRHRITEGRVRLRSGEDIRIDVTVTVVLSPNDGTSLRQLVSTARARAQLESPILSDVG